MLDLNNVIIPEFFTIDSSRVDIAESKEPMVRIDNINDRILYEPMYFEQGLNGAIDKCYVREGMADRLAKAAELLPCGYRLKIYDAWRPFSVQKELFDSYSRLLLKKNPSLRDDYNKLVRLTKEFVSYPCKDANSPFVHSTGGAVDLTIVDENGNELDMGTGFDDFTDKAHTDYFEHSDEADIKNNRRLLYAVMTSCGFTNFPSEWWHYDYGDSFWAVIKKRSALYSGVYSIK